MANIFVALCGGEWVNEMGGVADTGGGGGGGGIISKSRKMAVGLSHLINLLLSCMVALDWLVKWWLLGIEILLLGMILAILSFRCLID